MLPHHSSKLLKPVLALLSGVLLTSVIPTHTWAMDEEHKNSAKIPAANALSKEVDTQVIEQDLQQIVGKKYNVIRKIGSGSEALAFLVKDQKEQLYVAKYFTNIQTGVYIHANGFQNTIELLQALKHAPYMMKLIEYFDEKVMILEYVEGQDLYHFFKSNPPRESVKNVIQQILAAYNDMIMHHNLILGDPSPPNIFVSDLNHPLVKLIDGGGYVLFDKEYEFLKDHPERQAKFFKAQIVKDSNGQEIEVTTPMLFTISLSKIIHVLATLLTQYDPQVNYEKFRQLNFEDNVDLDGLSIRDYHTVNVLTPELKGKLHKLRHTSIQTLAEFKMAMDEYKEIFQDLKKNVEAKLIFLDKSSK